MTDQKIHLQSALDQQRQLASEIQELTANLNVKKELYVKLQGVVEYLSELGVKIDAPVEDNLTEETSVDTPSEE